MRLALLARSATGCMPAVAALPPAISITFHSGWATSPVMKPSITPPSAMPARSLTVGVSGVPSDLASSAMPCVPMGRR